MTASSDPGKNRASSPVRQPIMGPVEPALREWQERFATLNRLSTQFFWETDAQHRITWLVGGPSEASNSPSGEQLGKTRWECPSTKPDEPGWQAHRELLDRRLGFRDFEFARPVSAGGERQYSISGEARFSPDGLFLGYRGVGQDVTDLRHTEFELRRFRAAVDMTADGIHIVDCETMHLIDVNETACRYLGYTRAEFLALEIADFAPTFDRERLTASYDRLFTGEDAEQRAEIVHRHKNGAHIPIEIHRRGVVIDGRRIVVNVVHDITQRKAAEAVLRESEERFRSLTELSSDWYWEQDQKFRYTIVSGGVLQKDGSDVSEILGRANWELPGINLSRKEWAAHRTLLEARQAFYDFTFKQLRPDGVWRHVSLSGRPIFDEQGGFNGYRGIGKDVTVAKVAEERIQYLAYHDALTTLPNRTLFSQFLNRGISQAYRYDKKLAVLFIDLDRFKSINDTLGHDAGDLLLKEVAARLKRCLRGSDMLARLGGDEFVVLLEEVSDSKYLGTVAQKLLSAVVKPFEMAGQEFRVTASVGISVYPIDGRDEQTLMKNADIAMYRAKEEGKNNYQFYSSELDVNSFERLALESSLRRALERNELELHYQPKVDLRTRAITGMEALLRWQHPDLGVVAPAQIIPVAEQTGLIVPIGAWVLETACRQNKAWQEQGLPALPVAVNLSARQFADQNLLHTITSILEETGLSPFCLELEITESMVMRDIENATRVLSELRKMGVRIAIDDFGVGYSSLAHLKAFPIDTVKVDRSFIRNLPGDAEDRTITEAIITIGRKLGLTVVAHGVETQAQLDFLQEQACDEFQGFACSQPLPAQQFEEMLRRGQPARE
jgi:diguanylate cyclase (GGDEF)-like protein/PAS domain S-box-containing protein